MLAKERKELLTQCHKLVDSIDSAWTRGRYDLAGRKADILKQKVHQISLEIIEWKIIRGDLPPYC